MMVRVNEIDGDPYDHMISFDEELHSYDFPCASRVRKARRKKKGEESSPPMEEEEDTKKYEL